MIISGGASSINQGSIRKKLITSSSHFGVNKQQQQQQHQLPLSKLAKKEMNEGSKGNRTKGRAKPISSNILPRNKVSHSIEVLDCRKLKETEVMSIVDTSHSGPGYLAHYTSETSPPPTSSQQQRISLNSCRDINIFQQQQQQQKQQQQRHQAHRAQSQSLSIIYHILPDEGGRSSIFDYGNNEDNDDEDNEKTPHSNHPLQKKTSFAPLVTQQQQETSFIDRPQRPQSNLSKVRWRSAFYTIMMRQNKKHKRRKTSIANLMPPNSAADVIRYKLTGQAAAAASGRSNYLMANELSNWLYFVAIVLVVIVLSVAACLVTNITWLRTHIQYSFIQELNSTDFHWKI